MKIIKGGGRAIKKNTIGHFMVGDITYNDVSGHYYLIVSSSKNAKYLIDLTTNSIVDDPGNIMMRKVEGALSVE